MRKNAFSIWALVILLVFQQSALARIAGASPRRYVNDPASSVLPDAGSIFEDAGRTMKIARVTDSRDGASASISRFGSSSFNADSTRFFVSLDGVITCYRLDPSRLETHKQEQLFNLATIDAGSAQWSASDPEMIIGLETDTARIQAYDLRARSLSLIKEFTGILPEGEARNLSKSSNDDNRFAFTWREPGARAWHYVVVWDRASDNTYLFDITDPASGVTGFNEAHLDKSGEALIVSGDVDRVWRYRNHPQSESIELEPQIQNASGQVYARSALRENDSYDLAGLINQPSNEIESRIPRDNVSPDGRFSIFSARLNGSRSDLFIATLDAQAASTSSITWTHLVNCSAIDNTVQKTSGADEADDARATSVQSITSGDGHVEFTASETGKERFCGLNNSNDIHQSAGDINFAIRLSGKKAMVSENGQVKARTRYKAGNVFRIAIESGVVNYYNNNSVFYTSSVRPVYPLLINASLINSMSSVSNVMAYGARIGTVISISPGKAQMRQGESLQFTAVVTGATDEPVNWSATGGVISSTGLYSAPSTSGTYTVKATVARDPSISASASVLVTAGVDNTPPVISGVASSGVTTSAAAITWITNEPADTQVEYGATTGYGSLSTLGSAMVTSHSVALGGLSAGTLYHYRVKSKDAAGNKATSGDFTFTTVSTGGGDTTPPAISGVSASGVTTSAATIVWSTDEASDTQVEYGTTTSYGSLTARNTAMTTAHSAPLSALSAATLYHYRVKSKDAAGNATTSGDFSFMTSAATPPPDGGGVITDYRMCAEPPPPALPAAGGTFVDPVFGTTIMRVTDQNDGAFNATNYSYWPSFNKDSTRLYIIAGGQATLYSFDPVNFRISNKRRLFLNNPPTGSVPNAEDSIWSGVEPDVILGHDGLKIWAYNVASSTYSLVKDFSGELPAGSIAQMSRSIDDNVFAFTLKNTSGGIAGYVAWRRNNNSIYRVSTTNVDEVQVDKTGQYLVVKQISSGGAGSIEARIINLVTHSVQDL
ncbi:MAG TPA: fibronectin type III domain-containing protein, partial [Blastocatellia bacterium]